MRAVARLHCGTQQRACARLCVPRKCTACQQSAGGGKYRELHRIVGRVFVEPDITLYLSEEEAQLRADASHDADVSPESDNPSRYLEAGKGPRKLIQHGIKIRNRCNEGTQK